MGQTYVFRLRNLVKSSDLMFFCRAGNYLHSEYEESLLSAEAPGRWRLGEQYSTHTPSPERCAEGLHTPTFDWGCSGGTGRKVQRFLQTFSEIFDFLRSPQPPRPRSNTRIVRNYFTAITASPPHPFPPPPCPPQPQGHSGIAQGFIKLL